MTYAENIVSVFDLASPLEYDEGLHWYDDVRELALELSPNDVWRGAGVIAAYAANVQWDRTVEMASESLYTGTAFPRYFGVMVGQAQRILDGEHPLNVLGGQKVRAFCAAIADPDTQIATIDRHAHDIAMGKVFTEKERKIGKRLFNTMSEHYRQAAIEVNHTVSQMQAITWVVWRNRKGMMISK